jgi:hypothetical protein
MDGNTSKSVLSWKLLTPTFPTGRDMVIEQRLQSD